VERGCDLGFAPACQNVAKMRVGDTGAQSAPPTPADYPIILRGSKGDISDLTSSELQARASRHGWPEACGRPERSGGE
jgi:hypothetical protein